MLFLSPRFFHSSFIHSTGTCGLPFSTAPQQHPRQSATCATRTRFVCMEKLVDVTILAFSSCKCIRCLGARHQALAAKARVIYLSAEAQGKRGTPPSASGNSRLGL